MAPREPLPWWAAPTCPAPATDGFPAGCESDDDTISPFSYDADAIAYLNRATTAPRGQRLVPSAVGELAPPLLGLIQPGALSVSCGGPAPVAWRCWASENPVHASSRKRPAGGPELCPSTPLQDGASCGSAQVTPIAAPLCATARRLAFDGAPAPMGGATLPQTANLCHQPATLLQDPAFSAAIANTVPPLSPLAAAGPVNHLAPLGVC